VVIGPLLIVVTITAYDIFATDLNATPSLANSHKK